MAPGKCQEGLVGGGAMRKIRLQQPLYRSWRILRLDIVKNLLTEIGMWPKAASGEHMIAFDRLVALPGRHLCRDQADIADKMLRTGVMTASQMDVERRVDGNAGLAPVADLGGMAFGVGSGELAAGIARAGDQPGTD